MVVASNTHLHMVFTSSANICLDFGTISHHVDISFTCCKLNSLRPGVSLPRPTRKTTSSFSKERQRFDLVNGPAEV